MPSDRSEMAGPSRRPWRLAVLAALSIVTLLIVTGLLVRSVSDFPAFIVANQPAGFAPIVDEVRPVPSTVGQGSGERR